MAISEIKSLYLLGSVANNIEELAITIPTIKNKNNLNRSLINSFKLLGESMKIDKISETGKRMALKTFVPTDKPNKSHPLRKNPLINLFELTSLFIFSLKAKESVSKLSKKNRLAR